MFPIYYLIIILFLGSFTLTYIIIPRIIAVVRHKSLMDHPNQRSSHHQQVPSLGGVAFYIVIMLGIYFIQLNGMDTNDLSMVIVPGLLVLFIIGLKDDLVLVSPLTKIGAQLLAITFVLSHPAFHIVNLHGFLGIQHISLFISIPLVAFVMIVIINAFNLIDGIDGLASIVAIVIFGILGLLFYLIQRPYFVGISVLMIGCLLAFLRYNLSLGKKIFMGDTGSLIIGFLIACATVRLFAVPPSYLKSLPFQLENLPLVVMAILIVPFFDTARVFAIRVLNKKRPFSADRNHIHHLLIDRLHLSHGRASFLVGLVNVMFILVFMFLGVSVNNWLLLGVMIICIMLLVYFFYRIDFSYSNLRRRLWMRRQYKKFKKKL